MSNSSIINLCFKGTLLSLMHTQRNSSLCSKSIKILFLRNTKAIYYIFSIFSCHFIPFIFLEIFYMDFQLPLLRYILPWIIFTYLFLLKMVI
jgi:hypothetical protein